MIVIWAIKKEGEDQKQQEAMSFLRGIDRIGAELYFAAPILTEILSPYKHDSERRNELISDITQHYKILPFDFKSSLEAADLINQYGKDPELRAILENETGQYHNLSTKLKFDIQIVSCAIAHKMDGIISEEKNAIKTYASGRIPIFSMNEFIFDGTSGLFLIPKNG
ncbi:MAG: hypothetical protein H6607_12250 [Flavobacteriales bacterium]|nr:hypothetical protein [Flavobacteriales bacterium]